MMADQTIRLYTAEQVRGLDKCAIEGHGIPGMTLMEKAGVKSGLILFNISIVHLDTLGIIHDFRLIAIDSLDIKKTGPFLPPFYMVVAAS